MYKYLLWDIDGTILDFLASEKYAIKTLFKKFNIGECTDDMINIYSKINIKYWEALERNEMTKQEILVGRFSEFFISMGIDGTLADSFNNAYQETLGDCIVFVKNAEATLKRTKEDHTLIAVTNGTKTAQTKKLRESGLDKIFDFVYISEDIGFEKPNKEYFDYVFKHSGITDKDSVLIIGDSLTSDIKGGENAGIDTCWFNPNHKSNNKGVSITYEIDDLIRLDDILKACSN